MDDQPINVLLIEDKPGDVRLIREMLAEARGTNSTWSAIRLAHADRLRTGLARLAEGHFDVVLLDLSLPDAQGLDTFVKTQAQAPEVPLVVLTGFDDETLALQTVREGAQDYLIKGQIDPGLLVRSIHYAIERLRLRAELERKTLELRAREACLRNIIEKNGDGILVVDRNGRVRLVNPAAEILLDRQSEELRGELFGFPVVAGETAELDLLRRDRERATVEMRVVEIEWEGEPAYLSSLRDITARKRAEEALRESKRSLEEALAELRATQQQVIQQERLHALGAMASGIAHDFNNALSPILGYSELLLRNPETWKDPEQVTQYLQLINTSAHDAADVVSGLREFYRPREEDETFRLFDLRGLVAQVISLTQPKWKDQAQAQGLTIRIETDLQGGPLLTGNESDLREVLTNLILNAVDAMPQGGIITLRTRTEGEHTVLEVSDTGLGMTEEVRKRCLEPFFSTKGEEGTGLGLARVYGILQRHEGTIDIQSEPGQGTTFTLRLPVQTEWEAEGDRPEAAASSPPQHVLVVEDQPEVRSSLVHLLAADGHIVEAANNGLEALEKFQKGTFDVVLTDRAMPEMSGDQLALAIKQLAPRQPILMVTGFGKIMEAGDERPEGVDLVLHKPLTLPELRQAMAQVSAI
jgi:signal transduction histidine kinase